MHNSFKIFLLLCCFSFISLPTFAQNVLLSGQVVEKSTKQPVFLANVILLTPQGEFYKGVTTDENGSFQLNTQPGTYDFQISFIGYESLTLPLTLEGNINLGTLEFSEKADQLGEIEIISKIPPVVQRGDTTIFNSSSYKTNPDANAMQLLEKMPGMVMQNGKLQAQGEDVKKVLVDGKPFFGNDPNAALQNLPSEVISKIEVFDDQSDQAKFTGFDDGNYQKTLNIITKPEFREGVFGNVSAGYGSDERYKANASVNVFNEDQRLSIIGQANNVNDQNFSTADLAGVSSSNGSGGGKGGRGGRGGGRAGGSGGVNASSSVNDFLLADQPGIMETKAFGLNFSDEWGEKIELSSSYFFNEGDNSVFTNEYRTYFGETNQVLETVNSENSINKNHRANLRLNYELDSNNTFLFQPSFTSQKNDGFAHYTSDLFTDNGILYSLTNDSETDLSTYSFENSFLWQHKFEKPQRTFSVNLMQSLNPTEGTKSSVYDFDYTSVSEEDEFTEQQIDLDQTAYELGASLSYTEPLAKDVMLKLNYSPSFKWSEIDQDAFQRMDNDADYIFSERLSNRNNTEIFNQEASLGAMMRKGNSTLTFNAAYEWSELMSEQIYPETIDIEKSFQNFLPSFMYRYNISKSKNLRVSFRSSTSAPSINQLQEVVDNSNLQQLYMGNLDLEQQRKNNLFIRYSSNNTEKETSFFMMASGNLTKDYIGNSTIFNETGDELIVNGLNLEPGIQLTTPENLGKQYSFSFFTSYGIPLDFMKSNLNFNLTSQISNTPSVINELDNNIFSTSSGLGLVLSSNISKKIDFTLSSNSSYEESSYTQNSELNNEQFVQNTKLRAYYNIVGGLVLRTDLNHQYKSGLNENIDPDYLLWNAELGYKFLKDNRAEFSLIAFDILNENTSISRNVTESYFEDITTKVLEQYFMLSLRYKL